MSNTTVEANEILYYEGTFGCSPTERWLKDDECRACRTKLRDDLFEKRKVEAQKYLKAPPEWIEWVTARNNEHSIEMQAQEQAALLKQQSDASRKKESVDLYSAWVDQFDDKRKKQRQLKDSDKFTISDRLHTIDNEIKVLAQEISGKRLPSINSPLNSAKHSSRRKPKKPRHPNIDFAVAKFCYSPYRIAPEASCANVVKMAEKLRSLRYNDNDSHATPHEADSHKHHHSTDAKLTRQQVLELAQQAKLDRGKIHECKLPDDMKADAYKAYKEIVEYSGSYSDVLKAALKSSIVKANRIVKSSKSRRLSMTEKRPIQAIGSSGSSHLGEVCFDSSNFFITTQVNDVDDEDKNKNDKIVNKVNDVDEGIVSEDSVGDDGFVSVDISQDNKSDEYGADFCDGDSKGYGDDFSN